MLSIWQACCGSRKQVNTFSPVLSSVSVWNLSNGCAWFSDNHIALSGHEPSENGRYRSLHEENINAIQTHEQNTGDNITHLDLVLE